MRSDNYYVIHPANGPARVYSRADLIRNAEEQRAAGCAPHYYGADRNGEVATGAGYLVYSTLSDGCAVVFLRDDGTAGILTGPQGDFIISAEPLAVTVPF